MTDDTDSRLGLIEARLRVLEAGALRSAAGLQDHESRIARVEAYARGRRNIERLEAAER